MLEAPLLVYHHCGISGFQNLVAYFAGRPTWFCSGCGPAWVLGSHEGKTVGKESAMRLINTIRSKGRGLQLSPALAPDTKQVQRIAGRKPSRGSLCARKESSWEGTAPLTTVSPPKLTSRVWVTTWGTRLRGQRALHSLWELARFLACGPPRAGHPLLLQAKTTTRGLWGVSGLF